MSPVMSTSWRASLGARLLNRTSRRLSLTETGKTLYDKALSILEDVAEAEAIASSAALQPRGRLRVNAPLSFGILHLAPLWPRFMTRYPDIELDISLVDRVVDLVEEGYDLAVRISRGGSPALVSRKLATARHLICASPDYVARHGAPESPEDLNRHACIAYTHSDSADEWRLLDDAGKVHSVAVPNIMQTNNGDTARAAALAGLGIIRQPTFLIGEDLRQGRLVPLLSGLPHVRDRRAGSLSEPPPPQREGARHGGLFGRGIPGHAAMGLKGRD